MTKTLDQAHLRNATLALSASVRIARPQKVVYAFAANHAQDARWREGVREMTQSTPGTVQLGTRTHEVLTFLGGTYVTDCEVVTLDEGREYTFQSVDAGTGVRGVRRFTPLGTGTLYTSELILTLPPSMRPWRALLGWLYRRRMGRDLARLRQLLEASGAS